MSVSYKTPAILLIVKSSKSLARDRGEKKSMYKGKDLKVRDKILISCQPMLKLTIYYGYHQLFLKQPWKKTCDNNVLASNSGITSQIVHQWERWAPSFIFHMFINK